VILTPELIWATEIVAALLGAAFVVLAAYRRRACWLAGAASSVLVGALSIMGKLPMQGALNAYYVAMSVYGYWNWTRASAKGGLPVGTLPWRWHLLAAVILVPLSWLTASLIASELQSAWPLIDSLAFWFSLFATWLQARARIENWMYWIIIDGVLVFLYYDRGMAVIAFQFVAFTLLAIAGLVEWRRNLRSQVVSP
jgi:nicotinamide mononucleotide transporter